MLSRDTVVDFVLKNITRLGIDMRGNTKITVTSSRKVSDLENEEFFDETYYYINIDNYDTHTQITPFYYNSNTDELSVLSANAFMNVWDIKREKPISSNYMGMKEVVKAFNAVNEKANTLRYLTDRI